MTDEYQGSTDAWRVCYEAEKSQVERLSAEISELREWQKTNRSAIARASNAEAEVRRLEVIVAEALSGFECTQDPKQYPIDHWARRASAAVSGSPTTIDPDKCEHRIQSSRTFCDNCGQDLGPTFGVEITAADSGPKWTQEELDAADAKAKDLHENINWGTDEKGQVHD